MLRTHTCGELRKEHAGKEVTLAGWVDTHRIQGKISFLILRDKYGKTQCFLDKDVTESLGELRRETVVQVKGEVKARPDNQVKKELATGEIELSVVKAEVLGPAAPLPFDPETATEDTRMQYRYLDLRKPEMSFNLIMRHKAVMVIRNYLNQNGVLDIERKLVVIGNGIAEIASGDTFICAINK